MPPRRRISLAAAVFDFPAAPGHSTPQQNVPDSWLELFTSQYADAGVFLGIFTSCRAGRDWALRTAPQIRVTLNFKAAPSLAGRMRQATAALDILRTRSTQCGLAPARLTVIRDDTANSDTAVAMLLGSLWQTGAGRGIGALSLETSRPSDEEFWLSESAEDDNHAPDNLLEVRTCIYICVCVCVCMRVCFTAVRH